MKAIYICKKQNFHFKKIVYNYKDTSNQKKMRKEQKKWRGQASTFVKLKEKLQISQVCTFDQPGNYNGLKTSELQSDKTYSIRVYMRFD